MEREWYREEINKILKYFNTSTRGLTNFRVLEQRKKYGENIFSDEKIRSFFSIFIDQFKSPLIYVLVIAALIVFFLEHYVDGGIILFIIILNAIIGAFQEGRAQDTLSALKKVVKSYATVIREGKEIRIPDHELVPGDIVSLKDGDSVAADSRIIESNSLKINESSLTGESTPVLKSIDPIAAAGVVTSDQTNMVFRGTYVISGLAKVVVVQTGTNTVIGQISKKLVGMDINVPLKKNIRNLSQVLVGLVILVSAILFLVGINTGYGITDMFVTVVAVAVSAIPESLPVVVTLVLATGVWRMSKRNVLVKRLQAVEALGQAKVIALDKTGTITKNQMAVEKVFVNNRLIDISGSGYEPNGEITENGKKIDPRKDDDLDLVLKTAVLTSIAETGYSEDKEEYILKFGDPTEASLLVLGQKAEITKEGLEKEIPKIFEEPFSFETKYHATINKVDSKNQMFIAGSPEIIIEKCTSVWQNGKPNLITDVDHSKIQSTLKELSREGYRILALATKFNSDSEIKSGKLPNITFVGLIAIIDSIRPEVESSVNAVRSAGMKVIMITGDHVETAKAIAGKVGIYRDGDGVLNGNEMKEMTDGQLDLALDNVTVFARVTANDKVRVIEAYKRRKETIAMTGDGVNDALSLVSADLGVSMGKMGTEVAREASDLVLLDDKFGNIISAAEEGRNIYWTIRKSILYLLSTNVGELMVIVIAVFAGLPLPLLAAQIIWLNLVTDTFLVVALSVDPKEENLLKEKFHKPSKFIVDWQMGLRILLLGGLMTIVTLIMFVGYIDPNNMVKAWTISLTVLTVFQWYNIFNVRSRKETIFSKKIFNNKYLLLGLGAAIILHLFAIYTPFMQKILQTTALNWAEWGIILVVCLSIILVEEVRKLIYRIYETKLSRA